MKFENKLKKFNKCFPKCYINFQNELVSYPYIQNHIQLNNIENEDELDAEIITLLIGEAYANKDDYVREYHRNGLKLYFDHFLSSNEVELIYKCIGNHKNDKLFKKYIKSTLDVNILYKEKED